MPYLLTLRHWWKIFPIISLLLCIVSSASALGLHSTYTPYSHEHISLVFHGNEGVHQQLSSGPTIEFFTSLVHNFSPSWYEELRFQLFKGPAFLSSVQSSGMNSPFLWGAMIVFGILLLLIVLLVIAMVKLTRMKEAYAESERFLNSVIENIPDMVFVKQADSLRFVRLNKSGEQFLGVKSADIMNHTAEEVFSPELAANFTQQDHETLSECKLLNIPEEKVVAPGGVRYLHTKKIPILDENGKPAYLLGISRDMTGERNEKEQRLALEERLIQAEKMESIGTLAGGIAHDFNNILSSIIGYAELARAGEDLEKNRKYLAGTLKGAERARELVRQILTFSRKTTPQKSPVDLSQVVLETMRLLRSTLPSTIGIEEDLCDEATIIGDSTQVQQIIFNLCTNAYHSMMDKGGMLAVSIKPFSIGHDQEKLLRLPAGEYLRLAVADTGVGMDPETRQRMFDPYFTTKGPEVGTGLGLAVVHGIVKNHGGQIHAYSEKGVGTTIHIYFPRTANRACVTIQKEGEFLMGRGEHIMLVDDERDLVDVHRAFLENRGYRATGFTDAQQALQAIRQQPGEFQALITDMTMPRLTGVDLAREVLEIEPDMPIILLTGHSVLINRESAMEMGISAYCEKPIRLEDLLKELQVLINKSVPVPA